MGGHVPRRRCVGCGRVAPKSELVRLVARSGPDDRGTVAVPDRAGTLPGRGAYLCRGQDGEIREECARRAAAGRRLGRALRAQGAVLAEIVESVSR